MSKIEKVLFTGKTHTTVAHREGAPRNDHGRLDIKLSAPRGGSADSAIQFDATQPHPTAEQLFAGAWSACYIAAIGLVAQQRKVELPKDLAVEIEVDLGMTGNAYFIQARFNVNAPGLPYEVAEAIAKEAHEICPYSKATHGNIDVALNVVVD
ncbi:Ohr family peroxiredoxin [Pseudomonas sp. JS3066]|jgi:Ohr subfamily peroxiredoxin|uniref:Ohr family peroxiredoxin n=1 Tax=unclassified Pseudomonas TaxID=196821 RepID=UPI000EAA52F3|nr:MULTISPECIES: Ohr family peroxiredoxin [unclassified Pseudomonas]AYF86487.1 Ohr family peroxiredoxin [Pseudomonas sp. DY-1]MRK23824.1 Ohr family peroxiredoxin [Pseudomonas sp. JG-B]WVK96058.1 Ohr family peroxiredoxin [Pseudomonas sp. JS3066]